MKLAISLALFAVFPVVAQNAVQKYVPPKTSWGDPDLQGLWPATDSIGIPMQRPESFGSRALLTEQEYGQREAAAKRTAESDSEEYANPNQRAGINPPSYWLERGKPSRQASLVVDPPNGRIPPLTSEGLKRQNDQMALRRTRGVADSWEDQSYYDRCISRGVMGSILPVIYNNGNQIIQAPGLVVIRYEMIHEARIIPLDGRPHVAEGVRSYMGDPRGHWEGNTLVVETTNLLGNRNGINLNGGGLPHSDALRLIERFTRTGPDTIQYQATIDDPKTWAKPWTLSFPLNRDKNFELYEYACHEGNYAMLDMLSGARADEAAAAKGK
ncbi:MAG: hypothetical protein JO307_12265 [Bryobacterales bacterium]|nr:hypothetical protein [Bryobacterales bacterium]MBV9399786.1 hypothetical protein [Bryobacterales bacterium]